MDLVLPIIGAIVMAYLLYRIMNESGKDAEEPTVDVKAMQDAAAQPIINKESFDDSNTDMENQKGTRDLFLETLSKIGCQYELGEGEEDSDKIYFAYQGENFTASASNDRWYVHLWDICWGHVELYDIDEFTRLRKAINGSNLNNSVMTVYTIDEAGSNVDVHCKTTILFIPQIPELENYLRLELNDFFRAHQYVGNEMAKLREQEESVKS